LSRQCQRPGCPTPIAEFVDPEVLYCGYCQYDLIRGIPDLVSSYLDGRSLPDKDIRFLFNHLKVETKEEFCPAREFSLYLGFHKAYFSKTLQKDWLSGKKVKRSDPRCPKRRIIWMIPFEETVRILDIERNWITVYQAAKLGVKHQTLLHYVHLDYFGPTHQHYTGALMISRSFLPQFKERYAAIVKERRKLKSRRYWQKDRLTPEIIGSVLGVSGGSVSTWIRKGWLPAKRFGHWWLIKRPDFREFLERLARGEFSVRPLPPDKCRAILESAPWKNLPMS